jgi:hypothetical protein
MKNLFIAAAFFIPYLIMAQDKPQKKNVDPKYFYCYKDATSETEDFKLYTEDALAQDGFSKLRVRIFNKTNDYLIFKPADATFSINGQNLVSKDKQMIVPPNDEANKVIDVKGKGLQADKFTFDIKSLYKVANSIPAVKVEDLPVSKKEAPKKEVAVAGFKCNLKKTDLQTNKSILVMECMYTGDGIGILDPTKVVAVMPKGQENPNADREKPKLLEKGQSETFAIAIKEIKDGGDMQKEPFVIKWNDTFKDSKITPLQGGKIEMELDAKKTSEKNQ